MLKHAAVLLPFFVSLFWTIHFFVDRKQNSRLQTLWMLVMGLSAIFIGIAVSYGYFDGDYGILYKLDTVEVFSMFAFIPTIYLCLAELMDDKKAKSPVIVGLLFSPIVWFGFTDLACFLWMGDAQSAEYMRQLIEAPTTWQSIASFIFALTFLIQTLAVLIYAIRSLRLFRCRMNDLSSGAGKKSAVRHRLEVLKGVVVLLLFYVVFTLLGYINYSENDTLYSIIRLVLGGIHYYVSYHMSLSRGVLKERITKPAVVPLGNEGGTEPSTAEPPADLPVTQDNIHLKLIPKFNQVIDEERIFLQKNLRVDDVARLVYTNRTYISNIIKESYNCSFWEFINHKRIEYAKEQIARYPHLTQEELAEQSGFTHATAFSRAFKQCEGVTFRDWRASNK